MDKIIASNKLYTITIVLSIVVCVFLSVSVESRPKDANRLDRNANQQVELTSERLELKAETERPSLGSNTTAASVEESTASSNKTEQTNAKPGLSLKLQDLNYDFAFFFRLFVFLSAFCLVIFASIFVKSLNSRTVMYGYLDTKCGDEERLMSKGHASDYWDDEDEVVMFDAVDFKKEHYKD